MNNADGRTYFVNTAQSTSFPDESPLTNRKPKCSPTYCPHQREHVRNHPQNNHAKPGHPLVSGRLQFRKRPQVVIPLCHPDQSNRTIRRQNLFLSPQSHPPYQDDHTPHRIHPSVSHYTTI